MKEKVSIGNIVKFAGAFVACAIGSGFATGQEIMQFFTGQGIMSIAGSIVTTILFAWVGGKLMKHGFEQQFKDPNEIFSFYFGRAGKVASYIFQIFLYGVYVIMIAGAGATLAEYFGLNPNIGRIMMAVLAFFTVILGLSKLSDILGSLGVVIIFFAIGVGVYSMVTGFSNIPANAAAIPGLHITKSAGGWLGSAILYPAYNAVIVLILTCSIGKSANSAKEAEYGGVLGGALFGAAVLAMNLGLMAHVTEIFSKSVPTLTLADAISPVLGVIFSIIVCCGIYTTTVPMIWGNVRQFAEDKTLKFVIIAAALTGLGLLLGMTPFKTLINVIYPASGVAGLILMGFMAYREYGGSKAVSTVKEKTSKVVPDMGASAVGDNDDLA